MKNGAWKYFHEGEDYVEIHQFIFDIIGEKYTKTIPNKSVFEINGLKLLKKVRIVIDVFDD